MMQMSTAAFRLPNLTVRHPPPPLGESDLPAAALTPPPRPPCWPR